MAKPRCTEQLQLTLPLSAAGFTSGIYCEREEGHDVRGPKNKRSHIFIGSGSSYTGESKLGVRASATITWDLFWCS